MFPIVKLPKKDTKRIRHYDMADGFLARVELTPQDSKPDRYQILMTCVQVDMQGNDIEDPVAIVPVTFVVSHEGLGDTTTLEPMWVRSTLAPTRFPDRVTVTSMPAEKKRDQEAVYHVREDDDQEGTVFVYDIGVLEKMRQHAVTDLAALIAIKNAPAPAQALDL